MKRLLCLLVTTTLLCACTSDLTPLVATDISIKRPMPGMQMSAGYLTLTNNTADAITISSVASPEFAAVQLHETVMENDVAKMRELDEVVIPAGGSVEFKPGGKHLMLMRPVADVQDVSLQFIADEAVLLSINVTLTD